MDEQDETHKLLRELHETLIERATSESVMALIAYDVVVADHARREEHELMTETALTRGRGRPVGTEITPLDHSLIRQAVIEWHFSNCGEKHRRALAASIDELRCIEGLIIEAKKRIALVPDAAVKCLMGARRGKPPTANANARRRELVGSLDFVIETLRNTVAHERPHSQRGRPRRKTAHPNVLLGQALADAYLVIYGKEPGFSRLPHQADMPINMRRARKSYEMTGPFYRFVAAVVENYGLFEAPEPPPFDDMRLALAEDEAAIVRVESWKIMADRAIRRMAENVVRAAFTSNPELEPGTKGRRKARVPRHLCH